MLPQISFVSTSSCRPTQSQPQHSTPPLILSNLEPIFDVPRCKAVDPQRTADDDFLRATFHMKMFETASCWCLAGSVRSRRCRRCTTRARPCVRCTTARTVASASSRPAPASTSASARQVRVTTVGSRQGWASENNRRIHQQTNRQHRST